VVTAASWRQVGLHPVSGARAEAQCVRHQVVDLHRAGQGQHVPALLVGDGDLLLGKRASDPLQCQAVLANLDEMMKQLRLLTSQPVLQRVSKP
jgi:hypothetical protein